MPANKYTTGNNTGNVLTKVTLPGSEGTVVYYLKDTWAREQLENLTSYTKYLGVVDQETPIVDGQDTNPVSIGGVDIVPENGNIVIFGQKEFIYNGDDEIWQEFGDLSGLVDALGELAYVDTASTGYQPEGSVSAEFEGSEGTVEVSGSANLNLATGEFRGTEGTVNSTGTIEKRTIETKYTPEGIITINASQMEISIDYTPEGTITASFEGATGNVDVSGIPQGIVQMAEIVKSLAGNYTPSGTVEVNVDLDVASGSINEITSVGTLPSLSISAVNMSINATDSEQLDFFFDAGLVSWNAGTLPSYAAASVVTGVAVSSATGNFSGDTVLISATFSGSNTTFSGAFTPSGDITDANFDGSATTLMSTIALSEYLSAFLTGSTSTITTTIPSQTISTTGTFTPAGSVTLVSTPVSITASGSFTPAGSITNATFTGSSTTITVSADSV